MSFTLEELKEYIYENDLLESLLNELGCSDYKFNPSRTNKDDFITARLPKSSNPRGIQIYLTKYLNTQLVGEGVSGDIYALVGFILYETRTFEEVKENLYYIKTHICNVLDIEDNGFVRKKEKKDWNYWLKDIKKKKLKEFGIPHNPPINNDTLNQYVTGAWHKWIEEGISHQTQTVFNIGFDLDSNRVTIPIHDKDGNLIGIKGRYVGSHAETIKRKKYSYLISCSKAIELFNLHRALPHIMKKKEVIVVEGAKTTMLFWEWGFKNAVSLEGDRLSSIQAFLLKKLGIEIDIVFAWDKDKSEEFVKNQIQQIKNRNVFYLFDEEDLLEEKDSPCDKGKEIFEELYLKGKIKFDK